MLSLNLAGVEVQNPNGTITKYEPTFPQALVDEMIEMAQVNGATEEQAFAFILSKYNSGIAILKQDTNGDFKRLNTKEHIDDNENKTYVSTNCK
ncbi:MAG: hypothetical protein BGN92_13225 [Sphingobacteriales bacterium 41-5]|nr:MAG: hypothetical protein BGN92_13225 [Sphingobacteriales bacterium 41-5]